ncbi:MAG: TlpA family protein disulfide reductase [Bacteroidales bacterium]|nr:TlpA family protein disulfide reductase [Bacteroidales bacterium]
MKKVLLIFSSLLIATGCIKDEQRGADLKVGDIIPDFEVMMSDGSVVTDDDLKENVSVVMFFHTSCEDCQQALPVMQRIYDEYASENLQIVLISREQDKKSIDMYWNENCLKMPYSAQNDRKVYRKFASTRIPRIYVNEKGGIIRHIFTDDPVPSYDYLKDSLEDVLR